MRQPTVLLAALLLAGNSWAEQAPEARIRELEALVRELSERVARLEGREHGMPGAQAEPAGEPEAADQPETPDPPEAPRPAPAREGGTNLESRWDRRLRFRSRDGDVDVRLGGRLETDWTFLPRRRRRRAGGGRSLGRRRAPARPPLGLRPAVAARRLPGGGGLRAGRHGRAEGRACRPSMRARASSRRRARRWTSTAGTWRRAGS